MKGIKFLTVAAAATALLATGCKSGEATFVKETMNLKPSLFASLDSTFSVPDGLAVDGNNNLVLAVPNYLNYKKSGAKIVTFNKAGKVINTFNKLPKSKVTGGVYPMGIMFGPDNNLYIADNQFFENTTGVSRVLRVNYKNGKPVDCDVVVEGTALSNAIRWEGNYMYVSDTVVTTPGKKNQSGVYRFSLEELSQSKPVQVNGGTDKHLITNYTGEIGFGADGITFDKDGNMYCGLFGDGQVFKTTFNSDGSVDTTIRIINNAAFECCDGIWCDKKSGKIYLTNSQRNSVWVYDIAGETMQRLWKNEDDTGKTGLLDQPCEPIIWNGKLYVVNFDMTFPMLMNHENDEFNTISVFDLEELEK